MQPLPKFLAALRAAGANTHHRHPAFTLIEMVVVVTLIVMLMTSATLLFFNVLVSDSKTEVIQTVKEEGDFAMGQMLFLLRNAVDLKQNSGGQICVSGMDSIALQSLDSGVTELFLETDPTEDHDKIASNSGVYLTSSAVEVVSGPTFNCSESADRTSKFVNITFTLRKGSPGIDQPSEINEQELTGSANLRSY